MKDFTIDLGGYQYVFIKLFQQPHLLGSFNQTKLLKQYANKDNSKTFLEE